MNLLQLIPLLAIALLLSCNNDDLQIPICEDCNFTCLDTNATEVFTNSCQDNWECNYKTKSRSKVDLIEFEGISDGENVSFQFIFSTDGDPVIADDEYTGILVFETSTNEESFLAEDAQLKEMNAAFRRICFCDQKEFIEIEFGCLQGKKVEDNSWFVQGELTVLFSDTSFILKFDAYFN